MFQHVFEHSSTKTFLQVGDKSYSYKWLQQRIKQISGFFKTVGLKPQDRLLLALSDDVEMSIAFLAALSNGIVVVIADPEWKAFRANAIIERSKPACIIADKETLDIWKITEPQQIKVIPFVKGGSTTKGLLSKFLQKNKPETEGNDYLSSVDRSSIMDSIQYEQSPEALAYIIFTSGTTADSKGVMITHGNLTTHLATLKRVYDLNTESKILNQLLLCHADGCIQGPVLAVYTGCTLHRPFRFSIEKIPSLLDYCFANNISHLFMVPAMLNMIVQFSENYEDSFNYSEFKAIISVSAHLEAALWDRFESVFKVAITNVYGLTETVAGSLFCGPSKETYRKYTIGKPADCEIRIINEQSEDVLVGATGELCLKGAHIMKHYWGSEEHNEHTKEGWFYTGDLASQDDEGFVKIKGRKKNLIISGGINIQPEEITECLLKHEFISEACAIGLPDEVFGEKLAAAVVLKQGHEVSSIEIVNFCRSYLDEKKVPNKIFILPSLPKGVSGKVQLNSLKENLLQYQPDKQSKNGQYLEQILNIAAEVFQVPVSRLSIDDTSNTVSGWDSLAHLIFITTMEEHFKISFSTAEVMTMNSVKKALALIKQKYVSEAA
jgi:long-chain acyl-CoA synthetase